MNQMTKSHQTRVTLVISVVRDLTTLALIGLFLLGLHHFALPFRRGFHCDDETIRYPFKDSTVPSGTLHVVGIIVNVGFISLFEYMAFRDPTKPFHRPTYLINVYCRLVVFGFGAITSELITEISKYSAGRLRPHFLDVCRPKMRVSGLSYEDYCASLKEDSRYMYITDYTCSGEPRRERDTRLSFMSGHSSYAAYTGVFAIIYLQSTMNDALFGLTKPCLQVLIASMSFYTGLSRVSDYKHHWQDVLAGLTQGTLVAILINRFVWPNFYSIYTSYRSRNHSSVDARAETSPKLRTSDREAGEELEQVY